MLSKVINLELMGNPYNWLSVILIIAFGLMALAMVSPQPKD